MDPKSCCCRKSCPRNVVRLCDEASSQKSSEPEYIDKQTQKATDLSSGDQNDQSPATSETHFNRNYENINTDQQQPSSSTYAPQFNQTHSQVYPYAENCSSFQTNGPCDPSVENLPFMCKCPCMASPITKEEKTYFQPQQQQRYSAAIRNEFETYSSSSSTMSEHFPIRLIVNTKHVPPPYNSEPYVLSRPKRLQPQCLAEQEASQLPKSFRVSTKCEYSAEYYSCSSASSEEDNPDCSKKSTDQDRNVVILKLMHQMIHLLTEDVMPRKDIPRDFVPTNIHVTPELREPIIDANIPKLATSTQSQQLRDIKDSDDACSKLRILLNESHKHKSEDSQTSQSDECSKLHHPSGELLKTSTLSSSLNDEDTSCDCSRRKTLSNPTTTLPHLQIPPPCPCFYYYTSIWASAQAFGIPIPEDLDQWNKLFPNNPLRQSQHSIKEEVETVESKCRNRADPQSEKELNANNEESEKDVEEVIEPYELSPKPLDNFHYSEEADTVNPTENEEKVPTQHLEFVENRNALKEIEYTDEDSQLHSLETEAYGISYDNKEEPDRQISNHDYEVLTNQTNPLLNTTMSKNEELEKEPTSQGISNLEPEIIKPYYNEESHEETPCLPQSTTMDDIHFDNDISEGSDDDELAKEKRDERCKNRSHKDSCKCPSNQCTTLTRNQQQSPGVEEFKYFIDSIILDLEAMEYARRKCNVIKNVCMPATGVCPRESFPVTIVDVQDLGTTSLYVKWTIHDCYGIGGYEIFVDGYLTNRYYNSRHEAAVISDVDITTPHRIALVAQPHSARDHSLDLLCGRPKCKSLAWKPEGIHDRRSYQPAANLWTPSIYLYDPAQSKASAMLAILNGDC